MRLKYTEKRVNLGKREFTVVIPQGMDSFVNTEYIMDGDRRVIEAILISMIMLIENPNRIIYFPLWKNKPAKGIYRLEKTEHRCQNFDVVFMSYRLRFPIHDWKELRGRIRKDKGKPKTKEINLELSDITAHNLCKRHEKTKAYYKKLDLFDRYFRFDTHFMVGGPYSFAKTYLEMRDFLKDNLEQEFMTSYFQYWRFFPQESSEKNNWLDVMELGFYDRRYEQDHINYCKKHGCGFNWDY